MSLDYQKLTSLALESVSATLDNESEAVQNLALQYQNDEESRSELVNTLRIFYETNLRGGKIVACGIGKSYKIATKIVATFKSLSIDSDILHPSEALHGDLGLLNDRDCLLFFTASGNTPELLQLLPHISPVIPIVLLTCNKLSKLSALSQVRCLLYADLPEHLKEDKIHGVPAPTISTTLSLALADSVALALAEMITSDHMKRKKMFSMKHPGGSIGSDLSHLNDNYMRMELMMNGKSDLTDGNRNSYSSLLSLNQLHSGLRPLAGDTFSTASSILNSDSEDFLLPKVDVRLSSKFRSAKLDQICQVDKEVLTRWDELDLLRSITLYDFISFKDSKRSFAAESSKLRSWYKLGKYTSDDHLGELALKQFALVDI